MMARGVTVASTIAAVVLLVSFGLFAVEQARDGSNEQVAKLGSKLEPSEVSSNVNQAAPSPKTERQREKMHSGAREAIDDVNDVLVSPFTSLVDSSTSIWVQRGIPTLIALLLFGVGL